MALMPIYPMIKFNYIEISINISKCGIIPVYKQQASAVKDSIEQCQLLLAHCCHVIAAHWRIP